VDVVSGVAAGGRRRKQTLHTGGVENEGVSFTAGVSFADERAEAPVQRRRSRKQTLAVTAETEGEAAGRLSGSGGDSGGAQDEAPARRRARKQTLAAAVDDGVQHGEAGTEGSGGPQPSRPDGEQLEPEPEPAEDGAGPQIHDLSEFGQKAAAQLRAAAEDAERATQARSDAFARWVAWLALVWLQRERERERGRERETRRFLRLQIFTPSRPAHMPWLCTACARLGGLHPSAWASSRRCEPCTLFVPPSAARLRCARGWRLNLTRCL
jgi:hypothetical protein